MLRFPSFFVFVSCIATSPTMAGWNVTGEESAFADKGTFYVASENDDGYKLGFRCSPQGAEILYITVETLDPIDVGRYSNARPTIVIRVDDAELRSFYGGVIDSVSRTLRVTAQSDLEILRAIRDGKRRIAVALSNGVSVVHESKFSPSGSTESFSRFMKSCGYAE